MLTCWNGLFLPQMDDRYRMWRAVRENICSSRTGVILMLYMEQEEASSHVYLGTF